MIGGLEKEMKKNVRSNQQQNGSKDGLQL